MTTEPLHRRKQHHFRHLDCRLNRFVFFLTLCTNAKKAFFSNAKVCEIIVSELEHRRLIREIKLFCYCLLPDHLHLLISFDEMYLKKTGAFGERALQNLVSAFKRYTSRMADQTCGVKPLCKEISMITS